MSSKHTPGKWSADFSDAITIRDQAGNQLAICTHLNTRLGGRRDPNEVAANARLIAAAPELFEVAKHCEDLLMRHEINRIDGEELAAAALLKIRAALAKAIGA